MRQSLAVPDITQLLTAWASGDEAAMERLMPLVEAELRRLARRYLHRESADHTLQPTALVNEAYLRMLSWRPVAWQNRIHFFAVAAKIMRRILVNHAQSRQTEKRGGDAVLVPLQDAQASMQARGTDVIALDLALAALARFDPRKSEIVELRFFGGLSEEETAGVMNLSLRTVQREWSLARAWLHRELTEAKRATPARVRDHPA